MPTLTERAGGRTKAAMMASELSAEMDRQEMSSMEVSSWEEREGSSSGRYLPSLTIALINLASIVERADEGLLPAVYKEVGAVFHVGPSQLGLLTFIRALVQSLSSPIAGYLAMRYDRSLVVGIGTIFWGLSTGAVGFTQTYWQCAFFRAVNGVGLAVVVPALQSFIADSYTETSRGTAFGWLNLTGTAGSIVGGMGTVMLAGTTVLGFPGWRVAFVLMAVISCIIGHLCLLYVVDPRGRRPSSSWTKLPPSGRLSEDLSPPPPSLADELRQTCAGVLTVLRIKTFQVLILQGIIGSFPWQAMVFFTMWFQLIGFNHEGAALLVGFFAIGNALGNLIGGMLGDRAAKALPNTGRIICAQISAFSGVPFCCLVLLIIPQVVTSASWYAVTLLVGGLLISWNQAAVNNPIFAEVVPPNLRTMIYACDRALEGAFASLAAPMVGLLAEKVYGYQADTVVPENGAPEEAYALSRGLFLCMAVPFGLCAITYGLLYKTYSVDRDRARVTVVGNEEEVALKSSL